MTVDEKGLEAAEAQLMRVLGDQRYVMPANGMAQVLAAYEAAKTAEGVVAWAVIANGRPLFVGLDEHITRAYSNRYPTVPLYAAPPPPQVPHE